MTKGQPWPSSSALPLRHAVCIINNYKQVRPLRGAPRPAVGRPQARCTTFRKRFDLHHLSLPVIAGKSERHILSLLERASIAVVVVVVGAGEGRSLASLGRPRTILRCNVMLLVMRLSPIACSWYGSVRYNLSGYRHRLFSVLVTACHRLFTYHCLAPVLAEKNEHRLVLFAGKTEHHLDLVNTRFTPTNFDVHGSQVKVHPGARACGFRFRHEHERTQPTVSIDS